MPDASSWTAFVVATVALILIPGPNVFFLLARGVQHGRGAALRSAVGVEAATLVIALATAVGVAGLVAASAIAFNVVKWAGVAYLVWLGVRTLLADGRTGALPRISGRRRPWWAEVGEGFAVGISNPKVALFFVAFLPQFVAPGAPAGPQLLALGLVFTLIALILDGSWCLATASVGRRLGERVSSVRVARFSGLVYLALAVWAAFTSAPRRTPA